MKLLIVDDEELIRLRLKHIVEHSSLKFHSIETAGSVSLALESISKEIPAVILSDIHMPQKSGLEIARYVYEKKLPSRVILVTGFSDFEYAKAGIGYHVFDYILKPIDEITTLEIIRSAYHAYIDEKKHYELYQSFQNYYTSHLEEIRRQTIQQILFHPHSINWEKLSKEAELLHFTFQHYELIGCEHVPKTKAKSLKAELFITYALENLFFSILGKDILLYSYGNTLFCIVSLVDKEEHLDALHNQLESHVEHFSGQYKQNVRLGISRTASSLEELDELREQISICLSYNQMNSGFTVYYEDLPLTYNKLLTVNSAISNLITLFQDKNKHAFTSSAISFLSFISKYGEAFQKQSVQLLLYNVSFYLNNLEIDSYILHELSHSLHENFQRLDYFCKDTKSILRWLNDVYDNLALSSSKQGNLLVEQAKDFIDHNFSKPIGLAEVADHLKRNPSYISRLIKQKTGKNVTQLLTEARINNAKILLKNDNLKIYDIAIKVGYTNQQYFHRIFTEQTGMSPSDYRKITQTFR